MNMDDPTAQLRAQARAGDADAFGAVFDAYAKSVYNHAFRLTGDWSAAEEIMAMTFLEAWRGRAKIAADGGSLRPWLLGIATNLARGQHRTARRHRTALARLAVSDELPDFADDVSARLDDVARIKALPRRLPTARPAAAALTCTPTAAPTTGRPPRAAFPGRSPRTMTSPTACSPGR